MWSDVIYIYIYIVLLDTQDAIAVSSIEIFACLHISSANAIRTKCSNICSDVFSQLRHYRCLHG